jgi:hypothetical protein
VATRSAVPFLFAIWILYAFGYQTVWQRLNTQIQGTVISSRDIPSTGAPRYATDYLIRRQDGQNSSYVAGCTDASLPRSLPTGTQLIKKRWEWGYQLNGKYNSDYKTSVFYVIILGALMSYLLWSGFKYGLGLITESRARS